MRSSCWACFRRQLPERQQRQVSVSYWMEEAPPTCSTLDGKEWLDGCSTALDIKPIWKELQFQLRNWNCARPALIIVKCSRRGMSSLQWSSRLTSSLLSHENHRRLICEENWRDFLSISDKEVLSHQLWQVSFHLIKVFEFSGANSENLNRLFCSQACHFSRIA